MAQPDNRAEPLNASDPLQDRNNLYLSAALEWLRLRLRRLAGPVSFPTATVYAKPEALRSSSVLESLLEARKDLRGESGQPPALPAPAQAISDEMIAQAEQRMLDLEAVNPPPAL